MGVWLWGERLVGKWRPDLCTWVATLLLFFIFLTFLLEGRSLFTGQKNYQKPKNPEANTSHFIGTYVVFSHWHENNSFSLLWEPASPSPYRGYRPHVILNGSTNAKETIGYRTTQWVRWMPLMWQDYVIYSCRCCSRLSHQKCKLIIYVQKLILGFSSLTIYLLWMLVLYSVNLFSWCLLKQLSALVTPL